MSDAKSLRESLESSRSLLIDAQRELEESEQRMSGAGQVVSEFVLGTRRNAVAEARMMVETFEAALRQMGESA